MPHQVYENFVLEDKLETMLTTKLDMSQFLTTDTSLTAAPGMKIKVLTRTTTGTAEDVDMGEEATGEIEVKKAEADYEVVTTQAKFIYHDEEEMTDPVIVDKGMTGVAEAMTNDFNGKAIGEFDKATNVLYITATGVTFADVVDAIALMNIEEEGNLFMLINPGMQAKLRQNLADALKYVEGFVRTGYIGTVAGVHVYVSKAVPANTAYIATRKAVTAFMKKGVTIEQERVVGTRTNKVYATKVSVIALTDARKVVRLGLEDDDYVATEDTTVQSGKTYYEKGSDGHYSAVTPESSDNPKTEGWYEKKVR